MNARYTATEISPNTRMRLFFLKKFARKTLRATLALTLGLLSWVWFDRLPASFLWLAIFGWLAAISVHHVLHRRSALSAQVRTACRFVFFMAFPMILMFGGNRMAVWATAGETAPVPARATPLATGAIPMEEYRQYREEARKDRPNPVKMQKSLKKMVGKYLRKAKEMDQATKVLLIILGFILLLIIILLIALIAGASQATNSCLGNDDDDSGCFS